MNPCLKWFSTLTYTTGKEITLKNPFIAIVHIIGLVAVTTYVLGYTIIWEKGYQLKASPTGYVLTKVKGVALNTTTNMNQYSFFDSTDLVPSGMELDALFLTTAIVQTWQSRGVCDGWDKCVTDEDCSTKTDRIGVYTGECVSGRCQQYRWCPPEDDTITPANTLLQVDTHFDTFLKVVANFDEFDIVLMNTKDKLGTGKLIPGYNLFKFSDILQECGIIIDDIVKGALIRLEIKFECDFDKSKSCDPYPKFSWYRDDKDTKSVSSGYNFRKAYYSLTSNWSTDRLLVKYHGIRIRFLILGEGGKFDWGAFSTTLGSGIALTALATVFTEFLLKNCIQGRSFYAGRRCEEVSVEEREQWQRRDSRQGETDRCSQIFALLCDCSKNRPSK